MDVLRAENVSKTFTNHKALDDVNLAVPDQSIFGLLGPNGAGKTTFIRIINQILSPDAGRIFLNGEKLKPDHISMIGYLPEERGLYKKMKIGEQAVYLAQLKGLKQHEAKTQLKEWFEKFDILPWWNRKVEELSKGMQQKVQFIVTVLHRPKLLIFDEPFSGFDPINVNILKDEIFRLRENGATIIFSTHNMASVEELCDNIALINNSRKILEGKVDDIKNQFKTGTYELHISSNPQELRKTLPPFFELEEAVVFEENKTRARIKLPSGDNPNDLLKILMEDFMIYSFHEILPTMNDIFINQVNQYKQK